MIYLKTFESYMDVEEWANEMFRFLNKYNLFPEQIRHLREFYWPLIEQWYSDGKYSRELAEKIAKELELSTGGMSTFKSLPNLWQNIYYK
jgi:hypothetical protein